MSFLNCNKRKKINFVRNRFSINFCVFSLFFIGFFHFLRKIRTISKNNFTNVPTTSYLISKTTLDIKIFEQSFYSKLCTHRQKENIIVKSYYKNQLILHSAQNLKCLTAQPYILNFSHINIRKYF